MSADTFHLKNIEDGTSGHALKKRVTAVYGLEGYIERRYRNGKDGEPVPYWTYVKRGGEETRIESEVSLESLQKLFGATPEKAIVSESIDAMKRLFVGLLKADGEAIEKVEILQTVAERFESFTTTEATGYYRGEPHPTLIIEIAATGNECPEQLARDLADKFEQEAVGLESHGIYRRVYASPRQKEDLLVKKDYEHFNKFVGALSEGRPFEELDAETRAWWLNRY